MEKCKLNLRILTPMREFIILPGNLMLFWEWLLLTAGGNRISLHPGCHLGVHWPPLEHWTVKWNERQHFMYNWLVDCRYDIDSSQSYRDVKIWAVTLMLNVLRDIQGAFSASALQDIQEMDINAPRLLLEVCIDSLTRLDDFVATKSDKLFSGD